ncbi:hypothetical protein [Haloarchaeobius amylolyticus]|uniref:hypothetical protein n=1 Tax=Haloarchaeobius amylolyticus TaxID=1198296 RepID=UPI00226DEB6F|nr:hypothetical protein [Haloarchaeobius amylolyticus]
MSDREDGSGRGLLRTLVGIAQAFRPVLGVLASILLVGTRLAVGYLRDPGNQRRWRRWFLVTGNRWVITGAVTVVVFLIALLLGLTDVIGVRESRFVTTMFSTIIAGLFSFVPIVVTVNQLTTSRLFDPPGDLAERIHDIREFRERVAALAPGVEVPPTDPARFLDLVLELISARIETLREAVTHAGDDGDDGEDALAGLLDRTKATIAPTRDLLADRGGNVRLFPLIASMIDSDLSGIDAALRRAEQRSVAAGEQSLTELRMLIELLDVTRQYYKVLYLQQELAALSRYVAYTGMAAFLSSTLVIMFYASGYPPVAHEVPLLLIVSATLAVAFSPFSVLFGYVIRVATLVKRTSAPGAFTPPGERPS